MRALNSALASWEKRHANIMHVLFKKRKKETESFGTADDTAVTKVTLFKRKRRAK